MQLVRHCWHVLQAVVVTQSSRTASKLLLDLLLAMDGFFDLDAGGALKADTGTLFGARDVFAATDGLLLATHILEHVAISRALILANHGRVAA